MKEIPRITIGLTVSCLIAGLLMGGLVMRVPVTVPVAGPATGLVAGPAIGPAAGRIIRSTRPTRVGPIGRIHIRIRDRTLLRGRLRIGPMCPTLIRYRCRRHSPGPGRA